MLKTGCGAEQREFKTAENIKRVLAFDLIVGRRILACVKLGRALPQLPANVLYTQDELDVIWAALKKTAAPPGPDPRPSQPFGRPPRRLRRTARR